MGERTVHRDETNENFLSPGTVHRDGCKNCPQRCILMLLFYVEIFSMSIYENALSLEPSAKMLLYQIFLSLGTFCR